MTSGSEAAPPGRRVRLQDVATLAKVSLTTASLILSGRIENRFSDGTVAKVKTAAASLGYLPGRLAPPPMRGRSGAIGILLPDLSNSFNADIIDGMAEICDRQQVRCLLAHGRNDPMTEERATQQLVAHQVDGLVLIAGNTGAAALHRWLAPLLQRGLPCVVVDEADATLPVDTLVSDDRLGMAMLIAHLHGRGHRRIGFLSAGNSRSSAAARLAGFHDGCAAAGIAPDLVLGDSYDPAQVEPSLSQLLADPDPPTAVIGANDYLAARAWRTAHHRKLRVPEDFAVAGYANDRHLAEELELTTVDQRPHELGRRAIQRLLARLDDPTLPITHTALTPHLLVRNTA